MFQLQLINFLLKYSLDTKENVVFQCRALHFLMVIGDLWTLLSSRGSSRGSDLVMKRLKLCFSKKLKHIFNIKHSNFYPRKRSDSLLCDLPLFVQLIQLTGVTTIPFIENPSIYCGKNPGNVMINQKDVMVRE